MEQEPSRTYSRAGRDTEREKRRVSLETRLVTKEPGRVITTPAPGSGIIHIWDPL